MHSSAPRLLTIGFPLGALLALAAGGYAARPPERPAQPGDTPPARTTNDQGASTFFGPALEHAREGRMPGEFERIDALMLGVNELIEYHPETLVQIVAALDGDTTVLALVSQPDQERRTLDLLRSRRIATDGLRFFLWPVESMWVRDFGPQQVLGEEPRVVDSEYTVPGRETENQLPMAFAATFGAKIAHSHLALEGGNLLSNGQGVCISSSTIIDQNLPRGHDLQAIGRRLNSTFGFTRWVYLKPLIGESTGHVDLFLTVGGTNKVILASYDPDQDRANAELMDENARLLADGLGGEGQTLEIIRIRQPTARDGRWLSYTNVIYANGVVLVPQYPDTCPDLDRQALDVYRRAFPDRRIVGIDTSKIATKRGGLHCLSLAIPRLHDPAGQSVAQR